MKLLLSQLFKQIINPKQRIFSNHKEEILIKQGREQFKKLLDKGLSVPVVLL